MNKLIQQLYWLYKSDKKQDTPYLSTVLTIVGISFILFVIIVLSMKIPFRYIFPFNPENLILKRWLNGSIYPTIFIFIFLFIYPKSKLEIETYNNQDLKRTRNLFVAIFIVTLIILFFLLFKSGQDKGLI